MKYGEYSTEHRYNRLYYWKCGDEYHLEFWNRNDLYDSAHSTTQANIEYLIKRYQDEYHLLYRGTAETVHRSNENNYQYLLAERALIEAKTCVDMTLEYMSGRVQKKGHDDELMGIMDELRTAINRAQDYVDIKTGKD